MAPEGKIKSKDLTYESNLPPFLQRLHAQKGGASGGDPDRHEHQIARPKKPQATDEDDGPTIVDESGETVSKEEMEKLASGDQAATDDAPTIGDLVRGPSVRDGEPKASGALSSDVDSADRKTEQKITDGTATKKRKAAKVVRDEKADDDVAAEEDDADPPRTSKAAKKIKKKAKPIKLAFDNDDVEGD